MLNVKTAITGSLLLVTLLTTSVSAQRHPNYAEGFAPDAVFQVGEVDNVNAFNGGIVMAIPIGHRYPVNGQLSYGLTLYFTGRPWHLQQRCTMTEPVTCYTQAFPNRRSNAGMGWFLSLGKLIPPRTNYNSSDWHLYEAPDGAESRFYQTLHDGDPIVSGVWYTRNGTYLRLKDIGNGTHEIEFPDRTIHRFNSSDGLLTQVRDRSGNWLNITYPDSLTTQLSDMHGRTQLIKFTSSARTTVGQVELRTFNATSGVYTFEYNWGAGEQSIARSSEDDDPATSTSVSVNLLTKVTFPDGSAYEVPSGGYHTTNETIDGFLVATSGYPKSLKLPTLGSVSWAYQRYPLRSDLTDGVTGVKTRTLANESNATVGTWQYKSQKDSLNPNRELKNTITNPRNESTEHFFSIFEDPWSTPDGWHFGDYSLPFTRNVTDGTSPGRYLSTRAYSAGGTLLRSTFARYERDAATCGGDYECARNTNRRVLSSRTTYHDDGGRFATVDYSSFDGLGHYRQASTNGNFDSGNVRTTFTNYNPSLGTYSLNSDGTRAAGYTMLSASSPWIIGTYADQSATEAGVTAKSLFCWTTTGSMAKQRVMTGTTPAANDVVRVYSWSSNGNLAYEYWYGGDLQALATSELCSTSFTGHQYAVAHTYQYGTLKTSRYLDAGGLGLSFFSVDRDIDQSTGLVATSRDSAGFATSFVYDNMGRLRWIQPAAGGDRWTEHIYSRATSATQLARVDVYERPNGSLTAQLARKILKYDAFGRLRDENNLLANGTWDLRRTEYDSMGWKASVSERQSSGIAPDKKTTFSYDPFGRVTVVTPPDGLSHQVTWAYLGARSVQRTAKVMLPAGETAVTTTELYDRQGRLWRVTEPSGASGANVSTTYGYDVGARLKSVSTTAEGVTQTRTFTYDRRGFLNSEVHPEKSIWYSSYDAAGNATKRRSGAAGGAFDMTYTYDRAQRLTQVRESGGSLRTMKSFTYATANGSGDWKNGKLVTAVRHNHDATLGNIQVTESYIYGGRQGRVSSRSTAASNGPSFNQSFAWNELGLPATVTYPACTFSPCNGAPGPSRTVTNGYSNGYLTSVSGFTNTITYHPNGLVNQIPHANGVTVTQANDPNAMVRPASITASSGAGTLWASGTYTYDGVGNIKSIGSNYYRYDHVSRLTDGSAEYVSGTNHKRQTYAYDTYGNMKTITTIVNGSTTNTQTLAPSPSTNRLANAGTTYDESGNQTAWNSAWYYTYDGLDMMTTHNNGLKTVRFFYTADDERIATYDPSLNRWTWRIRGLDDKVLREYRNAAGTWSWQKDYVYRGSSLLATDEPSIGVRHFALDHLGTPRLITSSTGTVVATHNYYPFGQEATSESQDAEVMKFTGHERDTDFSNSANSVDYMHARYYLPVVARFTGVDPGQDWDRRRPQSWNMYSYVRSNPLNATDPDGREMSSFAMNIDVTPPNDTTVWNSFWEYFFSFGSQMSTGFGVLDVASARRFYQGVADDQALAGNDLAAGVFEMMIDVVPESQGALGAELAMAMIPGGKAGKIADDLIRGHLKASKSYRSELGKKTYAEIVRLSKGSGPHAKAAKQMKKLIDQSDRLMGKTRGKP